MLIIIIIRENVSWHLNLKTKFNRNIPFFPYQLNVNLNQINFIDCLTMNTDVFWTGWIFSLVRRFNCICIKSVISLQKYSLGLIIKKISPKKVKLWGEMILSNCSEFHQLMMVLSHSIITESLCYFSCLANERIFEVYVCRSPGPLFLFFCTGCLSTIKDWVCISLHVS